MAGTRSTPDEPKLKLPVGHPQAGYVEPDLSFRDPPDAVLPDEELEIVEERNEAREEEAKAVAENEDKVAKEEQAAREEQAKKARERLEKVAKGELTAQQASEAAAAQATLDATAEPEASTTKSGTATKS